MGCTERTAKRKLVALNAYKLCTLSCHLKELQNESKLDPSEADENE